MTAYATVAELRDNYLPQVAATAANDAILQHYLDEATDAVTRELTFDFAGYAASASAQKFMAAGGNYLHLPNYQAGTLTAVATYQSATSTTAITDYEVVDEDHRYLWRPDGWQAGRYVATAKWGYGTAPASLIGVVCQVAVNLWYGRARGQYSDVVGVEGGGAVGYQRNLTNYQRMVIAAVRREYEGVVAV
jgi:hypothetical protein